MRLLRVVCWVRGHETGDPDLFFYRTSKVDPDVAVSVYADNALWVVEPENRVHVWRTCSRCGYVEELL